MSRIEEALAAMESLDQGEHFTYTNIANTYGVSRVTLARRHQGIQASKTEQAIKQQLFNPQQELELVKYITRLTEDGLAPTRDMIQSFASQIIKGEVGNEWVTRFIYCNKENLITK
jgi:SOS response regulatory protein OraA/RecX